ncbi:uncharacterized protein UBRO_01272 [Ustilago bromivora]|uniref:Uncharacterized protein n=1 Tax=Ustilago bromivora TaxID=307758 RepID=A0A1K0GK68_9BASI|nr:uncharacterized protein UBRO_01272 [Ustilago bromivora]SYW84949.1 uncharacterized protein UBRO2_05655 [Ustilago bromivora]
MSDMPARTFSEADRQQQAHSQHRSTSQTWSPNVDTPSATTPASAASKRFAAAGPSSPRTPIKRPWESPPQRYTSAVGQESAEEDELSDETSNASLDSRNPLQDRRLAMSKRKDTKAVPSAPNPKRSKWADAETSPAARSRSGHMLPKEARSRSSSPRTRVSAPSADRPDLTEDSKRPSERVLAMDEIDTFLDLIYKHHPEAMTAENMRQSVEVLYSDWEEYCARRQVPVKLAKKPLMDEYHKIFHGVYGPEHQAKARSIAHELSQRSAKASAAEDAGDDRSTHRRDSSSRRSLTRSSTDEDSDDEDAGAGDAATGGDADAPSAPPQGSKKKADADEAASSKKSNIAQVGRNGLAVLPPGLFDILRNHLRDDILSSIMPSVRNDLTEQTRELFLQNQDLFGRIKEMEDRIRNQDLWIRHLLSRDPADLTTSPVGAHMGATGLASAGVEPAAAKTRPFSASARDPTSLDRQPRHGPSSSESELAGGAPLGDYFVGAGPMSPRHPPRNEARQFAQQGMPGPHPWEGRLAAPGSGPSVSSNVFGADRWEADVPPQSTYRDRPPHKRRSSHTSEAARRPTSWQGEPQGGRAQRPHQHFGERHELPEGRNEPPAGQQSNEPRMSFSERRRLSAFSSSGGPSGPRGGAIAPTSLSTGPGSMHEEFRRPGPPMHMRDSAMSPAEPAYNTRRPHLGMPISHSEQYLGHPEPNKAPLPPRTVGAGVSPEIQKNKRGRPSKAEMASSRVDPSQIGRGSFGGSSHPASQPRPYLS